jgi:hypothetical protein
MRTKTIFLFLMVMLVSVGAFAQNDDEVYYPDYGLDGGGGGGWGICYRCAIYGNNTASCLPGEFDPERPFGYPGYTSCTRHQVPPGYQGPPYCTVSGFCLSVGANKDSASELERQTVAIATYFLESKLMKPDDLSDFIAVTDYALRDNPQASGASRKRLDMYRAKFKLLTGDELKPGYVPVHPKPPTKAPASITAAAR